MAKADSKDESSRTSFILRNTITYKLKYIALVDKTTQTEILDKVLSKYIEDWEKKNGKIKS